MTYTEHLTRRAIAVLDQGRRLPADLFYEMLDAGLDVNAIELQHEKEKQHDE